MTSTTSARALRPRRPTRARGAVGIGLRRLAALVLAHADEHAHRADPALPARGRRDPRLGVPAARHRPDQGQRLPRATTRTGPWLDRFGFFDVYASPWFAAIYLLLFISLAGCVLPRSRSTGASMRSPPAGRAAQPRAACPCTAASTADGDLAAAVARRARRTCCAGPLAGRRRRRTPAATGRSPRRRATARDRQPVFHVALLVLLVGVALGSLFGYRGTVIVREGEGFANTLPQYDDFPPGRRSTTDVAAAVLVHARRLRGDFESGGQQDGAAARVQRQRHRTASPTRRRRASASRSTSRSSSTASKVFLLGHGYAPTSRCSDGNGTRRLPRPVVFLPQDGNFTSVGVVKVPDADPAARLHGLLPARPPAVDDVARPALDVPGGRRPARCSSAPGRATSASTPGARSRCTSSTPPHDAARATRRCAPARPGGCRTGRDDHASTATCSRHRSMSPRPGQGARARRLASSAITGVALSLLVRRRRVWVRVTPAPAGRYPGRGRRARPVRAASVADEVDALASALGDDPVTRRSPARRRRAA